MVSKTGFIITQDSDILLLYQVYSKHLHIRIHDFGVQAYQVLSLFIRRLVRNQPEGVLNIMFLNFVSEILHNI